MTRIDFHLNAADKLGYACRLVRKIHASGQRAVVHHDDGAWLARLDQALWTFSPLDFIPHVLAGDPLAAETPIVLSGDDSDPPHCEVLVNLGQACPPYFSRFERLIEVVGALEDERQLARERWRFYRGRGYPLQSFDLAS
ncbi:MAG: DNA polymerase III subunit chi [Burkholderiales bacterium]|nr:MAG: DNA polymerase III subunit chi [Burkholderiales bacterium]